MLIAIFLFVVGFAISLRARIIVLIPLCVVLIGGFSTVWLILDEFDLLRIAVLIGYIFALNTGYLVGAALATSSDSSS